MKFEAFKAKSEADSKSAEFTLYGYVGDYPNDFRNFRRIMKQFDDEAGGLEQIDIRIHSGGGDVIDGWAIFNFLADHPARVTAYIEGWAASMAGIIAMAADEVVMPENAWFMIHNPWTVAIGESKDMRRMADVMDTMREHSISAYRRHLLDTDAEVVAEWMDAETWMSGEDADGLGWDFTYTDPLSLAAKITHDKLFAVPEEALALLKSDPQEEAPENDAETDTGDDAPGDTSDESDQSDPADDDPYAEAYDAGFAAGSAETENVLRAQLEVEAGENKELTEENHNLAAELADYVELTDEQVEAAADRDAQIKDLTEQAAQVEVLEAKLQRLLPGFKAVDDGEGVAPETWTDALAREDGDYVAAREKYPDLYSTKRDYDRENRTDR